ncbi:dTDP-4-amino-4,6-dideoxygalactose transaminase [Spirochaeta isovalerica]|uniref:dTDP-4-amino-4,6-dideoxygalactose transaminase n=2 Tax=Spirochaeta isovalerica TaxID=150 RepID=A0A841RGS7_9SPIO|nr:dTDP-4-amino-4,6-dideoxygalactose transaminase [Spirochaeta isovalerica]
MDSVLSCLISDQIGPGPVADELTSELCNYLNLESGLLIRDYYRAVALVLELLELKSGSRIILSPLSPGVYIDIFHEKGIIPLFADVDSHTALMNRENVEKHIEQGADAVLLFCPLGSVEDMEYYQSLNVPVIEDISENFGASFKGSKCGSFSTITIFSMEPDKVLTCGGGAAVFTADSYISQQMDSLRKSYGDEIFLADINAALAIVQLKNIEENFQKRERIADIFLSSLNKTEHKTLTIVEGGENVHFSFPIMLKSGMKEAKTYLMKKNIEPQRAFVRTALEISGNDSGICPVASGLILRTLLLPLYPSLGKKNVEMISKVISTLP